MNTLAKKRQIWYNCNGENVMVGNEEIKMKNEALERLKELMENKYGELDDDRGCYINGRWFSLAGVLTLMFQADEEV